jgi:hypothetical protein
MAFDRLFLVTPRVALGRRGNAMQGKARPNFVFANPAMLVVLFVASATMTHECRPARRLRTPLAVCFFAAGWPVAAGRLIWYFRCCGAMLCIVPPIEGGGS